MKLCENVWNLNDMYENWCVYSLWLWAFDVLVFTEKFVKKFLPLPLRNRPQRAWQIFHPKEFVYLVGLKYSSSYA